MIVILDFHPNRADAEVLQQPTIGNYWPLEDCYCSGSTDRTGHYHQEEMSDFLLGPHFTRGHLCLADRFEYRNPEILW